MTILHVITTIDRGGAENHLCELAKAQARAGNTVVVVYLKGRAYWRDTLESVGVVCRGLEIRRYRDWSAVARLRRIINEVGPDIVHAHLPPAEVYARLALLYSSGPTLIISKHNDTDFIPGKSPIVRKAGNVIGRWVASAAARVICISQASASRVQRTHMAPAEKVNIVYYGLDTRPFEVVPEETVRALRAGFGSADTLVIGTIARMVEQKRLDILLSSFAEFRRSRAQSTRLVIVGTGPLEADLRRLAVELDIEDACIWVGFREDIPALLQSFDIFALTSLWEGFGLVLLEAMAAGTPVVASCISALPEVVADHQTGLLVPPLDVAGFADAFRLLDDSSLRKRMGVAGRERARQFSLHDVNRLTNAVYAGAVASRQQITIDRELTV